MPDIHTEQELLVRVSEGDEKAFSILFYTYHKPLATYIYKLTASKEAAEEITQDAFVKAWRQRSQLASISSFRSWLFTICRNQALNAMRDHSRKLLKHNQFLQQQHTVEEISVTTDLKYLDGIVASAIAQLPPQQQKAYLLSRQRGMKHAEIATEMQLSPETVKRHISMALQSIQKQLRAHYPDLPAVLIILLSR